MSFFIDRQASRDSASSPHEKRLRSAFDHLEKAPQLSRPQFFFAHILSPHPYTPGTAVPLADGSDYYYYTKKSSDQYRREYVSRLTALNENLRTLVGRIQAKSGRPNVVILQADHGGGSEYDLESAAGTNLRERMSIFNALYLPEGGSRLAYAGMTPVNTFRIVLKKYLGLELELLEDRSYYSTWDAPFQFVEYAP
jgi:phosphoglycerol transferase MdoB-like AlkP superfamily enzyme